MRKTGRIFIIAFCVFAVVCAAATSANAQQVPDYLFLEVLDSNGKPVADATVESGENLQSQQTNQNGDAAFMLRRGNLEGFTESIFKVSKTGYFTYQDLGFLQPFHQYRISAKLELLKIPQTEEEKRVVGDEQTKREFLWAAKTGDAPNLRRLLKSGINPNLNTNDLRGIPGPKNMPAVIFAAASGSGETIKALLKAGVDISAKEEPFRSILITYLQADPFVRRKPKDEAERREMLRRYEDGVKILVDAGADINVPDAGNQKTIMIAAHKGYARIVKTLLDKGFSANFTDERGKTVLTTAADADYNDKLSKIETVNVLLAAGANVNSPNSDCSPALLTASYRGDIEVIKTLIKNGARINGDCGVGQAALISAVRAGKIEAAKFLIEAGADINAAFGDDASVLMIAAGNSDAGGAEMARMLLEKGVPVDAKDNRGKTALIYAIIAEWSRPNLDVVNLLLAAGANPNVVAGKNQDLETCTTPFLQAVRRREYKIMQILTANKADVNLPCGNGDTVLVYAIKYYEPELVGELIKLGADAKAERVRLALDYINRIKPLNEDSETRKLIEETIKIVEAARAK